MPRDVMHSAACMTRCLSVCPFIWMSVTFVYCIEMSKLVFKLFYLMVARLGCDHINALYKFTITMPT